VRKLSDDEVLFGMVEGQFYTLYRADGSVAYKQMFNHYELDKNGIYVVAGRSYTNYIYLFAKRPGYVDLITNGSYFATED
jgi:hypothetical protein